MIIKLSLHLSGLHDNYIMGEAASAASANPQFSQLKVTGKESLLIQPRR